MATGGAAMTTIEDLEERMPEHEGQIHGAINLNLP